MTTAAAPRTPERMLRYSGLIKPEAILQTTAWVIGVGAIGYQIARSLATMGVGEIHLVDMDKVEELNLGTQGWSHEDLGRAKVKAAAKAIAKINPDAKIVCHNKKWTSKDAEEPSPESIVFMCVDTMAARADIVKNALYPIIDSRMSALTIQTLYRAPFEPKSIKDYEQSMFSDEEAYQAPCTSRSTFFTAAIAAGLAINTWRQSLDGFIPLPQSLVYLDQMILVGGLQEDEELEHQGPGPSPEAVEEPDSPPLATEPEDASPQG